MVNFAVTPSLRIGYAYDHIVSDLNVVTPASHEIMLLFDINLSKKYLNLLDISNYKVFKMKNLYITLSFVAISFSLSAQNKETKVADKLFARYEYVDGKRIHETCRKW
jgi:hypothetical protein